MSTSPFEFMKMPLQRYADFSGRSRRMEYWMFFVGVFGATIVASILDGILGMAGMVAGVYGPIYLLVSLGTLIPSIAVGVRRMHDQDRSGWWIICPIVNIIFLFMDGTRGDNRFGPDTKAGLT
jgi:uncharacterized membrane protein YhaH (DUF805 family)